ncbi:hypothetical protein DL98DRAFT_574611 [Cadophora sp. DSE1049]|nr:hypothetical protein DL98DRAFT_574611 [Cadophora sp. DSE1049]
MSSYPSSTCATDGSNKSFPRHIGSTSANYHFTSSTSTSTSNSTMPTSHDATKAAEEAARLALYFNYTVEANPTYRHTSSSASVAAHSAQMRSYLDSFDEVMEDKK